MATFGRCRRAHCAPAKGNLMNILLIIVIVVAVILAITGGLVQSLQFLLWVGLVLLAIAVIAWLIRAISGSRRA